MIYYTVQNMMVEIGLVVKLQVASRIFNEVDCSLSSHPFIRINAAARLNGMNYSTFMNGVHIIISIFIKYLLTNG